jgi:hypothetical protein
VIDLVAYPFLLRPGMVLNLRLPADLTREDVERLSRWLATLPLDATSPPGHDDTMRSPP